MEWLRTIKVASRQSALALKQTNWVIEQLKALEPSWNYEIFPVVTKGDRILDVTLSKVGGKGLFVSEIEAAIVGGNADLAVHSLKDVPAELAEGLTLTGFPKREDPRDAFISKDGSSFQSIPAGSRIGTSSLRRIAQLKNARPDLVFESVRGNIDTRLRKLRAGEFDAIVLAAAGLHRMGWESEITQYLSPEICLPAIGQGILGIECRQGDVQLVDVLNRLGDEPTGRAALAERTLLRELNGSCQIPIAGYATVSESGESVYLRGFIAGTSGSDFVFAQAEAIDPVELGQEVADEMKQKGADTLLASL